MAKVKSLVESLKEGYEKAFDSLDKKVEGLGEIKINDIKDIIHPTGHGLEQNESTYIERIVVYRDKEPAKGEAWRPTLDTDLWEFAEAADVPKAVEGLVKLAYLYDKTTIRELIAMPYGWFKNNPDEDVTKPLKALDGKSKWDLTRRELRKYGFNLYKKGCVIKD